MTSWEERRNAAIFPDNARMLNRRLTSRNDSSQRHIRTGALSGTQKPVKGETLFPAPGVHCESSVRARGNHPARHRTTFHRVRARVRQDKRDREDIAL